MGKFWQEKIGKFVANCELFALINIHRYTLAYVLTLPPHPYLPLTTCSCATSQCGYSLRCITQTAYTRIPTNVPNVNRIAD